MKRKVKSKQPKEVMYVAVVCRGVSTSFGGLAQYLASLRPKGDWACFVGTDRAAVINKALAARSDWSRSESYPYEVLFGTLNQRVETPKQYKLKPIK